MADNAIGNISASVFMDEVKASFGGKLSYEPDDANTGTEKEICSDWTTRRG